MSDETTGRPGSAADLSRRMDRLEANHETLTREVSSLAGTVSRVEQNQQHAEQLNTLRFDALGSAVNQLGTKLDGFMSRIEGMISGEVETAQSREGRETLADYKRWRREVDDRLDGHDEFETQGRLLGRLTAFLVGGNALAIVVAIAALVR